MIALLLAAAIAATPTDNLAAYITKAQPKAKTYALPLARAIIAEGAAHGIRPEVLAAIAWLESNFRRGVGSVPEGSTGLYQLRYRDAAIPRAWEALRKAGRVPGYPKASWWRIGRTAQTRALRDPAISTYLVAVELVNALRVCRRLGHRIGRGGRPWHRHRDRFAALGHYQSGIGWPSLGYTWQLRRRSAVIRAAIQ